MAKKNSGRHSKTNTRTNNTVYFYSSAGLLLESAKDEYTKERERTQFLDNKASFFMSTIILIVTVFVPILPFSGLPEAFGKASLMEKLILYTLCLALIASFIIFGISFKKLYLAYKIQAYQRFNVDNVTIEHNLVGPKNAMEKALCQNYANTIQKNIKTNDTKAYNVQKGIKLCAIGFLILAISSIIMAITIGAVLKG